MTSPDTESAPQLGDIYNNATQAAASATETAKHDLDAVRQKAAEDVQSLGKQASEQVSAATDKVKSFAGDQKDLAAEQLSGVAQAISKVAGELENSDQATIGRYARDLANSLNKASDTVKTNDVDALMATAQDFGRSQPLAFLGAAALAGFVASRFALASTHRHENRPKGDVSPVGVGPGNPTGNGLNNGGNNGQY